MSKSIVLRSWVSRGLAALLLVGVTAAQGLAQGSTITGKVTNERGEPVSGASAVLVGTSFSSVASATGVYTISVPADRSRGQSARLQVRAIGRQAAFRDIILNGGTQTQDFQLAQDPFKLDELVVTGVLGATENKKLAIAIGSVSEAQIQEVPAVDPIRTLVGKVSGVKVTSGAGTPGAAAVVRMRSATNLTPGATQQPLIIVDGVLTSGSLSDINAQDIERIEVLKGAAGGSLYGSSAAAGVIQIFTRRGKGGPEGKSVVTFRNEYGQSSVNKFFAINESHYCSNYNPTGDFVRNSAGEVQCTIKADHYMDLAYPTAAPVKQQQKSLVGNGAFYTNYLSVGRRQGNGNLFASFESQVNEGIIDIPLAPQEGFHRKNFRINFDQTLSNKVDISVGAFYNYSTNQNQPNGGGPFFSVLQYPADVDLFAKNTVNEQPYRVDVGKLGAISSGDANPLYQVFARDQRTVRTRVQGNVRARYRPADWLSFDIIGAYDRRTDDFRNVTPKGTLSASAEEGLGSIGINASTDRAYNANITGRATKKVGDLNMGLTGSYFYEDNEGRFFQSTGSNFTSVGVPTIDNTDPLLQRGNSSQTTIRARNLAGGLQLDLKDRYIADVAVRRDGSSLFGADARWRTFYRASLAYRVSEDLKIKGIDELRIRGSRGTAGLRPFFNAQYETFQVGAGSISPVALGNKNLRPAYSTETEVGINLDFLKKFSLEYTYSTKLTKDQILFVPFSSVAGYQGQWQNAGTLDGNTHEASLQVNAINSRNWSWRMGATFDRSTQKVKDLKVAAFRVGGNTQTSDLFLIKEGEVYGSMWGYKFVRNFAELKDNPANAAKVETDYEVNSDGLLILKGTAGLTTERPIRYVKCEIYAANGTTCTRSTDVVQIGNANPDFSVGFQNTVTYRGLTVYGLVDWVQGGNIYNQPQQWVARAEFRSKEFDQRGKDPALKKAYDYYNAFNLANEFNEHYVEGGSYARLRELSVNYTFSAGELRKLGLTRVFSGLRLGLVGRNLFTITKYSGMDPETSNATQGGGDATTFRFDGFGYPNFRTISGIIEISF
jgi:TonB-linked SusC/RagA family outer membrane protein